MINKLGFGFLRLPKQEEKPDWLAIDAMTDAFLEGGGTFFDTCYTYLNGMSKTAIGCTGCGYCVPHCPRQIPIPQYIKLYNEITRYPGDDWKILPTYHRMTLSANKASDCVACRACEKHCPQKLTIGDHMKTIAKAFETSEE